MTYYLTLFDGKPKTFEDVAHVFDALYHQDCIITDADGKNPRTRDEIKQTHAKKFAMASKCTLLLFRVVTFDIIEIKYRLVNEEEDKVVHQWLTTDGDNKVVKGKFTIEESKKMNDDVVASPKKKRESLEGDGDGKEEDEEGGENTKRRKLGD